MVATALLALLQSASAPVAPPVPQRFSILADPCARVPSDPSGYDVVVCGRRMQGSQRLPSGSTEPPDHPVPVNPEQTGRGALAAQPKPCATRLEGCTVGIGPPPELVNAAIGAVTGAFKDAKWRAARRRDGAARVPIDLSEASPPSPSAQNVQP